MIPPPTAIYRRVALLIALAVCGPALVYFVGRRLLPDLLIVGLGYGTIVGHPVLAAAWCALGPGALRWRLPISFAWTCLVSIAVVLPAVMDRYLPRGELLLVVPVAIVIWLLVQVPLWGISLLFGLQLRYQAVPAEMRRADNRERQFGIRQLMIYTAAVGVLLGIGRLLLPPLFDRLPPDGLVGILCLVFATQILTSLPLIFAALLPRLAIPSVLLALFLLAAGTAFEIWIAQQMPGWNRRSDHWAVIGINITCALWTLAAAAIVRKSGYHFGVPLAGPSPDRSAKFLKPDAPAKEPA
jgi:hypothetical protein